MLNISDISVHFGGIYLFKNISFTVNQKDKIGLTGRNGSGKTTLMKLIAGIESPESGNISYPNEFSIGYLPQEIEVKSDKSIFDETKEALSEIIELEKLNEELSNELTERDDYESEEYHKIIEKVSHINERLAILGSGSIDAEVERILLGLGFDRKLFTKPVNQFSGGWQMRVELAKILLRKPDCILLDEPTNHLDIESVIWLEKFLKDYFGAIILVSHDRRFLDNITNRTVEISLGKIYDKNLPFTKFMKYREEEREQQFAAYKNQQRDIAQQERFIERFKAKANLATRVQSKVKQLEKVERIEIEDEDNAKINLRFPEPPRSGRLIGEAKSLSKSYGDNLVLDRIDFAIERGDKIAFVGKNGEGKSTLSKIFAKMLEYDGNLEIGYNVELGYFAQHQANMLNENLTVFETIDNSAVGEMRKKVRSLLGAFLFSGDDVNKKVKVLSGGEKSRLSIAKLMLKPINFLIMDEPTNHLDMKSKEILKNALQNFDASMIIVSHDREFLEGLTNRTVYFKDKKLTEYSGDIREFLEKFKIEEIDDINLEKIKKASNDNIDKSDAQMHRKRTKEIQREKNRLNKRINELEDEIGKIEENIEKYEKLFKEPEFFTKPESSDAQKNYADLQEKLTKTMEEWEDLSLKLEEL
jgi:ATP-binding cassette subfamily F protein 3